VKLGQLSQDHFSFPIHPAAASLVSSEIRLDNELGRKEKDADRSREFPRRR